MKKTMNESSLQGWNEVLMPKKMMIEQVIPGRDDIDVDVFVDKYSLMKCQCCCCEVNKCKVCNIIPTLINKLKKQQEIIDVSITAEVQLVERTNVLNERIDKQQKQIDSLLLRNQIADESNNVCNVLDVIFVDIISDVNKEIGYTYFSSWKHLRQHISRHSKNWRYYEDVLTDVLSRKYDTTLLDFDSDITGLYGVKGQRNRAFHPKKQFEQMKQQAINALSNGCLSSEKYSDTTLRIINKKK